jgi:hypothetical protein
MNVWDLRLNRDGKQARLDLPEGWNGLLVVLHGTVQVNGAEIAREGQLVVLGTEREGVLVESNNDATVLVLAGEPIDEPIVGHGPFVMNTRGGDPASHPRLQPGPFWPHSGHGLNPWAAAPWASRLHPSPRLRHEVNRRNIMSQRLSNIDAWTRTTRPCYWSITSPA